MKEHFLIDAIDHMDSDLIEEYVKEKDRLKRKKERKRTSPWIKWTSAVACLAAVVAICILPLLDRSDPSGQLSLLALTVYAVDGTQQGMELDQGFLNSSISGMDAFGKDVPTFEFYVAPVEQGEEDGIFEKYDIELSYNGKLVEGKDEHIRLLYAVPQEGIYGIGRYCIIGWFEETTDVIVTLKDKNSGEVVERMTVNVSYSEADTAYKLTLVELYSIADEK